MRRAIGNLMARSKREIPHYYLEHDIALTPRSRGSSVTTSRRPVEERILPAALFYKAVGARGRARPRRSTASGSDDAFVTGRRRAPRRRDRAARRRPGRARDPRRRPARARRADGALRDLTARARGGRLRGSEMTDATITVTNLGDQGVRAVFGVIYPPQVALVGFGKVSERVWADDGSIGGAPGRVRHALGRPPRDRRPHRRAVPGRDRTAPAPTGGAVSADAIRGDSAARSPASPPKPTSTTLAPDADLQEELDLDSMDFLNFLIALGESTGVQIPESDYAQVRTFGGCRDYVSAHLEAHRGEHRSAGSAAAAVAAPDRRCRRGRRGARRRLWSS